MAGMYTPEDDAAALASRRRALRAFTAAVSAHLRGLDAPQTYLEAERAVRTVTAADRILERLPPDAGDDIASAPPDPERLLLRADADRLMAAASLIAKPETLADGDRAMRYALAADRMLIQIYGPPRAAKGSAAEEDSEGNDDQTLCEKFLWKISNMCHHKASRDGYWPDGSPYDPEMPDYWDVTPGDVLDATAAANEAAGKPVPMLEARRQIQHAYDTLPRDEFEKRWPGGKAFLPP